MSLDRAVDAPTATVVDASVREQLRLPIAEIGPVLEVSCPQPMVPRDVAHGLKVVPDGFFTLLASEGTVVASQVTAWTKDVAFVQDRKSVV